MKFLELRVDEGRSSEVADCATTFVRACSQGNGRAARATVHEEFRWFHGTVEDSQWTAGAFAEFWTEDMTTVSDVRTIPHELTALWSEALLTRLAGVEFVPSDRIVLVDVTRGARPRATLGLVVRAGPPPTIRAAFDPEPLRTLLESTSRALADSK